ncbi:venom metalloprotease inhibitor-like [Megachile rotundata]|uniref:venom metalloprotease inhibitor-like n=1 Tax=Megachile rotundata TaxID=143995 RepID=UPI000614FC96|nr:PREDICTED: inducible metalloproteinase inhibitor protein-like [Megachile rotundata]
MFRIIFALFVALAVLSSTILAGKIICNRPHEEYQCGSACQTTCDTLGEPCPIVNIKCNDDCYCKEGYARNRKDICIPIRHCPKKRDKSKLRHRLSSTLYR